jgi:hypothetical protein
MLRRTILAILVAMAIAFGCVVISTSADAVVDSASIVQSPNVTTEDYGVRGVSCVSASDCVAVGVPDCLPLPDHLR